MIGIFSGVPARLTPRRRSLPGAPVGLVLRTSGYAVTLQAPHAADNDLLLYSPYPHGDTRRY